MHSVSVCVVGIAVETDLTVTPEIAAAGGELVASGVLGVLHGICWPPCSFVGPVRRLGNVVRNPGLAPRIGIEGRHLVSGRPGSLEVVESNPTHRNKTTVLPGQLPWVPLPSAPLPMQSRPPRIATDAQSCVCSSQPRPLHMTWKSSSRKWGRCVM